MGRLNYCQGFFLLKNQPKYVSESIATPVKGNINQTTCGPIGLYMYSIMLKKKG